MQAQRTPLKQLPSHHEFPQNADFTSAKKDVNKKVNVTVFAADCKLKSLHRYYPIVNVMPDCKFIKQYRKSQEQDIYFRDSQQLDMKILSKQQQIEQVSEVNQGKRDKLQAMLQQLKDRKIERYHNENLLTDMKKQKMKAARDLQLLQNSVESKVQRMKFLVMKQQNCIFQWNRHIYNQEKERETLVARLRDILTNKNLIQEQIMVKSGVLSAKEKEEQELMAEYHHKQRELQAVKKDMGNHSLHLIVLKMQLAPFMRVSFSAPSDSHSTRKKILEKSSTYWNKKNKYLSKDQIKYFVLIQLYPCWRRLLDRLSYHFVGYKQLLFKENSSEYSNALRELDEYIFQGKAIKYKSYIVLYSPRADIYQRMRETLRELIGLNNGIIHVLDVVLDETQRQNVRQVSIVYTFKGEKKVKAIQLVQLRQLTRESLHPYIVSNQYRSDKTSLIKIEVPFCFDNPAERIKMEDVYRMIERER